MKTKINSYRSRPVIKTTTKSGKETPVKKKVIEQFFKLVKFNGEMEDAAIVLLTILANNIDKAFLNSKYIKVVTKKKTSFITPKEWLLDSAMKMFNVKAFLPNSPRAPHLDMSRVSANENCCGIHDLGGFDLIGFKQTLSIIALLDIETEEVLQRLIDNIDKQITEEWDEETPFDISLRHFSNTLERFRANVDEDNDGGLLQFSLNYKQHNEYNGTIYDTFYELLESGNYTTTMTEFTNPNSGNTVFAYSLVRDEIFIILQDFIVEL